MLIIKIQMVFNCFCTPLLKTLFILFLSINIGCKIIRLWLMHDVTRNALTKTHSLLRQYVAALVAEGLTDRDVTDVGDVILVSDEMLVPDDPDVIDLSDVNDVFDVNEVWGDMICICLITCVLFSRQSLPFRTYSRYNLSIKLTTYKQSV